MRLGFSIPNNQGVESVTDLVDLAAEAEDADYASIWVSEHLFHAAYVARRLGGRPYHDPLTVLTAAACATRNVRLGTSVLILPWHHPARLGKTIATLDQLSGGRVDLGVGVAVTEDEFENLGIDFRTRGRRADDTLAALSALWYQDVPEHDGPFYRFRGQRFAPKPKQSPLPVHVGGGSSAALRRVARFGHGWHALGRSPSEMSADLQELARVTRAADRDPAALHVSIRCVVEFVDAPWERPLQERRSLKGTPDEIRGMLASYAAAGVDELIVDAGTGDLQTNRDVMQQVMALSDS
jgi:probable F420-dependent oxidoreductase